MPKKLKEESTTILAAPDLAAYCPDLATWAASWCGEERDVIAGEQIVAVFTPFLQDLLDQGYGLVDVRTPGEFAAGSISGAVNIPVDEIRERMTEFADNPVLVFCQVGQRGHTATTLLRELGVPAVNLDGGYKTWLNSPAAFSADRALPGS